MGISWQWRGPNLIEQEESAEKTYPLKDPLCFEDDIYFLSDLHMPLLYRSSNFKLPTKLGMC